MSELLTDLRCDGCGEIYSAYRPSREEIDSPRCPACTVSTWDGINRFFGRIVGIEPKQTKRKEN